MPSHKKHNCANSPHYRWHYFISMKNLKKILKEGVIGELKVLVKQGRVSSLAYNDGNNSGKKIAASRFISRAGRLLGWNAIKSNYFFIRKTKGGYLFRGRGLGHGIGLCQWGAYKLALEGKMHLDILRFYYDNAKIIEYDSIN